jgi:hypothetical protein
MKAGSTSTKEGTYTCCVRLNCRIINFIVTNMIKFAASFIWSLEVNFFLQLLLVYVKLGY